MRLKLVYIWLVGVLLVVGAFHFCSALVGAPGYDVQDVGENTTVSFHPVYLEGSDKAAPEVVSASRVRIPGWSRLVHMDKFHHSFRVKITVPTYRSLSGDSKVNVCWDQDPAWSLGECRNGSWRTMDKGGSWTFSMSPFQEKYVDIRVTKALSPPPVIVSVQDEKSTFRLVFLGIGVVLLVMAPLVWRWVPFYYGSAMTLGILTVVLFLVYQAIKLFPTGRKSTLYILLVGSLAGFGSMVASYFKSLISSFLWEMGISDDMYSPVAIFAVVGIALLGAYLGYLCVRKMVLAEDGSIDEGIAIFVLWSLRIMGSLALLQTSSDGVFRSLALIGGVSISWALLNVRISLADFWENLQDYWASEPVVMDIPKKEIKKAHMTQAQIDAVRRLPGSESLLISRDGLLNSPTEASPLGMRRKRFAKTGEVFSSTLHPPLPGQRPVSKQEYADIGQEFSSKAVDELVKSKEFAEWREANKYRVIVEPFESRQERPEEEIEQTAYLEEVAHGGGFFGRRRR